MEELHDAWGRPLTDLRISVTDRCNFRCTYCMPREEFEDGTHLPRASLLSFDELRRLCGFFVERGVRKLRLTGGEPLLRKDLPELVERLSDLKVEMAMTTNGVLLSRFASLLQQAGLSRVTVSLDALDEDVFQRSCDAPRHEVGDVLRGIEAAHAAGLPVKVNCVVRRGLNEAQVPKLAEAFRGTGVQVRFIEFMDVGTCNGWDPTQVVKREEIVGLLASAGSIEPLERKRREDVAELFRWEGQTVGIISSVSQPFCGACSRARLSADGRLFTCLFAHESVDLREPLRSGNLERVSSLIESTWRARRDRYSEMRDKERQVARQGRQLTVIAPRVEMSFIGG